MSELKLGVFIRKWRKIRGLTLKELGKKVDLSHPYLSQIETSNRDAPSPEILEKIAKALNIDYGDLMLLAGYWDENDYLEPKTIDEIMKEVNSVEKQKRIDSVLENIDLHNFLKQPELKYRDIVVTDKDRYRIIKILDILLEK
jgi:transcriptional regulator with XRE-family HTH domain